MEEKSKPLDYYDLLLEEALDRGSYETIPGTEILRIVDPSTEENIRVGGITELLPFSRDRESVFDVSMGIAGFLALRDFNARQSVFLDPASLETLQQCDFYMTLRIRDTAFKPSIAVREFFEEFMVANNPEIDVEQGGGTLSTTTTTNNSSSQQEEDVFNTTALDEYASNSTSFSPNNSSRRALRFLQEQRPTKPKPRLRSFATLGPVLSDASTAVATIASFATNPNPLNPTTSGGSEGIITLSATSGADELENPILYPYFARTISYSYGKAAALMAYMHYELNVKHLAILHASNDYGRAYLRSVVQLARQYDIQVYVTSYTERSDEDFESSFQNAMISLEQIPTIYHMGILTGGRIIDPLLNLYQRGLIGPNQTSTTTQRTWFFSGTVRDAVDIEPDTETDPDRIANLHRALHGSISVADDDSQADLDTLEALMLEFRNETETAEYFLSRHVGDSIFANQSNRDLWQEQMTSERYPSVSNARARSYDGVMALGLAVCNAQHDDLMLTTRALHNGFKNVTFQGASGPVAFLDTATRDPANMNYRLINLLMDYDPETNLTIMKEVETIILTPSDGVLEVITPNILPDGSTTMPESLAPIIEDRNLVSDGLRVFCWCVAGVVVLFSLFCMLWTIRRRNRPRVRASQPVFLILFSFGTLLIGMSIIPWTFQEPMAQSGLDLGCMGCMWFLALGFSITFGALFTRTRRISILLQEAEAFRKSRITAKDVMWVPILLVTINVVLLSLWTKIDPLQWERVTLTVDYFGRVEESYGTCFHFDSHEGPGALIFMSLLILVNVAVIFITVIQSYRSRYIPSQYNERFHLAIASFVMLEAMLLGIPLLVVSGESPPASMVIGSWIFAISAFAVLLPLFVPKILIEEGLIADESTEEGFRKSLQQYRSSSRKTSDRGSNINSKTAAENISNSFKHGQGSSGFNHLSKQF